MSKKNTANGVQRRPASGGIEQGTQMYLPRAVLLVDRVADRPLGLLGPILFRRREVCEGAKIVVTNTEEITDGPTERFEADLASLQ